MRKDRYQTAIDSYQPITSDWARWAIEVFFKQLEQTLKLAGFIGYSTNAIQWQIRTALLVWLLARFQAYLAGLHPR